MIDDGRLKSKYVPCCSSPLATQSSNDGASILSLGINGASFERRLKEEKANPHRILSCAYLWAMVEGAITWIQRHQFMFLLILAFLLPSSHGSGPRDWGDSTRRTPEATPTTHSSFTSSASGDSSPDLSPRAFLKKVVEVHSYYCGSNRICQHYSPSACYRCAPCQCDVSCHDYGDCCPDVPEKKATKHIPSHLFAGVHKDELDCLSVDVPISKLGIFVSNEMATNTKEKSQNTDGFLQSSFKRYFMISRCPVDYQGDRYHCEGTTGEAPVTSKGKDSFVFKNRHCAYCHDESDFSEWRIRISCDDSKNYSSFFHLRNVDYSILVGQNCAVSYAPSEAKLERRCYSYSKHGDGPSMISKCNETGEMQVIEPFLQRACGYYLAPKTVDGKLYGNVFCYLCNRNVSRNFTPDPGQCGTDPSQGEKTLEATVEQKDWALKWISQSLVYEAGYDVCGDVGVYDSHEQMCRPLFCAFGQRMRPGGCSCQPAFQEVSGLTYEIFFKLHPKEPIQLTGEFDLLHRLPPEMETLLVNRLHKLKVKIEDFAMAFNRTDDRGHCNQATNDLALYAKVKVHNLINQDQLQRHLLRLRKSKYVITTRSWNVTLQSLPSEMSWHLLHPSRRQAPHFLSPCVTIVANDHLEKKSDGTKRVGTTTPSPEVIHARMTSPPEVRVSSLMACVQVRLLQKEYAPLNIGEDLKFQWGGGESKMIPRDRYQVDSDGHITICLSDFIAKLVNKQGLRRTEAETIIAFVLLPISMSCLLVCLIVFTVFPVLRSLSGKNNMVLVGCLFLSQLTIFLGYTIHDTNVWCSALGVLCHYCTLSSFFTLAICSYHVYTIFNIMHLSTDVTKETRTFILYCCCIFLTPLVIIVIIIIASTQSSDISSSGLSSSTTGTSFDDIGYGGGPICLLSPTSSTALWLTLFLPLFITSGIAFVLFIMTFCNLRHNADLETNATDERHVHFYFRSAVATAITWIVGMAALYSPSSIANVRIAFVFCQLALGIYITAALVFTRRVAGLVSSWLGCGCCGPNGGRARASMNVMKLETVKAGDKQGTGAGLGGMTVSPNNGHSSVIVTGFRQKDSPRVLDANEKAFPFRGSNGYSTDESQI